jgi:hypothetical protein
MPLKDYISKIFNWIKYIISLRNSIEKDKNNLETIEDFQAHCELLYQSKIFHSILSYVYPSVLEDQRIRYYLDKTSAYLRSLDLILKCLEQRKFDYGQIYQSIQWYFIEPIENIVKLHEPPSLSFDQIWLACGLPNDQTKIDFKTNFIGNRLDAYDSKLQLSTCIHCEIRIIDYLIKKNIHEVKDDDDIEIGISKLPCYPCSLYIEKLNEKFNRNFCVAKSTTHGKIYAKWTFRDNEESIIQNYVNDQLYTLVKKELNQLQRTNRTKSGDSDKQETDLDHDAVNKNFSYLRVNTAK